MSIKELENKARELKELQRMAEELETEMDAIKDAIRAALGEREEVTAGAYKITYKPVTSTRIDSKALRRELPEMAECFTKTTTVRRLVIA